MNPRVIRHLQLGLAALDILMITVVFTAVRIVFKEQILSVGNSVFNYLEVYISVAWLLAFFLTNIYSDKYTLTFKDLFKSSIYGFLYFYSFVLFCLFQLRSLLESQWFIAVALFGLPLALMFNRLVYLCWGFMHQQRQGVSKVVIIGYNELSKRLMLSLQERIPNKEIVGICEDREKIHELHPYPILSNIPNALDVCKEYGVTEVYSTIAPEQNHEIYKLIQQADEHCIHFHIIPDTSVFINRNCYINSIGNVPVISLRREPLEEYNKRLVKKSFDVIVSFLVVTFILSWLIPIIALLIRLDSKGPVFFKQVRSGKGNKKFTCIKFRSMQVNNLAHVLQASKNDARLTRVGRFLRRTNLDEFPQFLNVLMGDMSIVGPRPHMLKHTMEYSRQVNQYMVRHLLKPGITGWAQVNGYRGEITSYEKLQKRIEHDLWYLENWSLWLDIKIICRTAINAVIGDENAY